MEPVAAIWRSRAALPGPNARFAEAWEPKTGFQLLFGTTHAQSTSGMLWRVSLKQHPAEKSAPSSVFAKNRSECQSRREDPVVVKGRCYGPRAIDTRNGGLISHS